MIRFTRLIRFMLVIAAALLSACDNDSAFVTETDVQAAVKAGIPTCTPGITVPCPCPGGTMTGVQSCEHDGVSYSSCVGCQTVSDGGVMMQKAMCDANAMASVAYPGKMAAELFGVRVIGHETQPEEFADRIALYNDGFVRSGCFGDYDLFIGP